MYPISVVVTTHNRKYEVRRALESVYLQTLMPFEIILIDDASEDGTEEYVKSLNYAGLKYFKLSKQKGPGAARNYGIQKATGKYIAFLDSDNEWKNTKIKEFADIIESTDSEWDIIFSKYLKHIRFDCIVLPEEDKKENFLLEEIWIRNPVDASAAVYKKSFLEEVGLFSVEMMTNIDWELLLRGRRKRKLYVYKIDKVLTENWTMYDSISENKVLERNERSNLLMDYLEDFTSVLEEKNKIIASQIMELNHCEAEKEGAIEQKLADAAYYEREIEKQKEYYQKEVEKQKECYEEKIETQRNYYEGRVEEQKVYYEKEIEKQKYFVKRKNEFYRFMCQWVQIKLDGSSVADKLSKNGYKKVAIYGAGKHGKLLYQDLQNSNVKVICFIDRNKSVIKENVAVYLPTDSLPDVDAIVISPYLEFETICQSLAQKCNYKMIALNELLEW